MTQKTKIILGWSLTGILTLVFIFGASTKIIGSEETVKGVAAIGITPYMLRLIGIVELVSIILFIIPRTGILGTLLLAAYLGGAIVTHLEHQQPFIFPLIIQCLVWITATIRFSELSSRISGDRQLA